jgi:hypothetical protein
VLKGDGQGNFIPLSILQSGIYIPGNGKGLVKLLSSSGNYLVAASQNQEALKLFELKQKVSTVKLMPGDLFAIINYNDGRIEKREFHFGSSFLSQSARFVAVTATMKSISITNANQQKRILNF